jgi:hypothetical protein
VQSLFYGTGDWGVIVQFPAGKEKKKFSAPNGPDLLLGPPGLLFYAYLSFFPANGKKHRLHETCTLTHLPESNILLKNLKIRTLGRVLSTRVS